MSYWRFPTSIFTSYSVEEVIRSSGLSKVYRARHRHGGQPVAIKVLRLTPGLDERKAEKKIARFQREATLCVMADHPNIIRLLDFAHEPMHAPYAVYEYAPGITLKDMIWQQRGLAGKTTATIMTQVLDALKTSHAQGIVHRDLKPENIMVDEEDNFKVKILDFGIGTWSDSDEVPSYEPLTLPNEFLGTPAYAAPEQLVGQKPSTGFDLYAWGLILFECLTGRPAVSGHSLSEVVCRQLAGDMVRLPKWMIQHPIADLLEKVLSRNASGRMANVQRIYEHFQEIDLSDLVQVPGYRQSYAAQPGQQTTITQDFAQHQDMETELLLVACLRLHLTKAKDSPLSDYEVEDIRVKEYGWLNRYVKAQEGKVVSVLANTFMVTFSEEVLGAEYTKKATQILFQLLRQANIRFNDLKRYNLKAAITMSLNTGPAMVEFGGNPYGIVPNLALDLLTRAENGSVVASEACFTQLTSHFRFTLLDQEDATDHPVYLVESRDIFLGL